MVTLVATIFDCLRCTPAVEMGFIRRTCFVSSTAYNLLLSIAGFHDILHSEVDVLRLHQLIRLPVSDRRGSQYASFVPFGLLPRILGTLSYLPFDASRPHLTKEPLRVVNTVILEVR